MRRTPILSFHADEVDREASRIEEILRDLDVKHDDEPDDEATSDDPSNDTTGDPEDDPGA